MPGLSVGIRRPVESPVSCPAGACPACGPRPITEFVYFGDATAVRPPLDAGTDTWAKAVYDRANPRGAHQEFWQHVYGCRCLLEVTRDTETHAISGADYVGADREATR